MRLDQRGLRLYPPLQRTQGWGTLSRADVGVNRKGWATRRFLTSGAVLCRTFGLRFLIVGVLLARLEVVPFPVFVLKRGGCGSASEFIGPSARRKREPQDDKCVVALADCGGSFGGLDARLRMTGLWGREGQQVPPGLLRSRVGMTKFLGWATSWTSLRDANALLRLWRWRLAWGPSEGLMPASG